MLTEQGFNEISHLSSRAAFLLGGVVTAFLKFQHLKAKATPAAASVKKQREGHDTQQMRAWDSYLHTSLKLSEAELSILRSITVSTEKHFKKLRHAFVEAYPHHAELVERLLLKAGTEANVFVISQ